VDEADWLACTNPDKMLDCLLGREVRGGFGILATLGFRRAKGAELQHRPRDRQLRLFAVACCIRIWPLLTDNRSRRAVQVSADYADGQASEEELSAAREAGSAAAEANNPSFSDESRSVAAGFLTASGKSQLFAARAVAEAASLEIDEVVRSVSSIEQAVIEAATSADLARDWSNVIGAAVRTHLLRDIFGNPFRPSSPLSPAVLAWNDATVRRMAEAIYDERAFDRLPILADALLDAGCDDEAILSHCREPGPHMRGCWVIDLLLGKE
jgi:hypothetical protein